MNEVVLDASAILAAINNETGGGAVAKLIPNAVISAVNLTEVHAKLIARGIPEEHAWRLSSTICTQHSAFDARQARLAGAFVSATRHLGLSLGDRACLALATVLGAPVYTADRAWSKLDVGITIHLLR